MQDPSLNSYDRDWLKPDMGQIQLMPFEQYKIIFQKLEQENVIFIVWMNNESCLHSTRKNYPDPMKEEFLKLKKRGQIEVFNKQVHLGHKIIAGSDRCLYFKFEIKKSESSTQIHIQQRDNLYIGNHIDLMGKQSEVALEYLLKMIDFKVAPMQRSIRFELSHEEYDYEVIRISLVNSGYEYLGEFNGLEIFEKSFNLI